MQTWSNKLLEHEFGKGYNVSFGRIGYEATNLTPGNNLIEGTDMTIDLETPYTDYISPPWTFKLTPRNFFTHMHLNYKIAFIFNHTTKFKSKDKIWMALTTENNSVPTLEDFSAFDGSSLERGSDLGELSLLVVSTEKFTYAQEVQKCRTQPYNELHFTQTSKALARNCSKPCKMFSYGKNLDDILKVSICTSNNSIEDFNCFLRVKEEVARSNTISTKHHKTVSTLPP